VTFDRFERFEGRAGTPLETTNVLGDLQNHGQTIPLLLFENKRETIVYSKGSICRRRFLSSEFNRATGCGKTYPQNQYRNRRPIGEPSRFPTTRMFTNQSLSRAMTRGYMKPKSPSNRRNGSVRKPAKSPFRSTRLTWNAHRQLR